MAEIVDGAARWSHSGTQFAFDGAHHTVDGHTRENRSSIFANPGKHGDETNTNDPNYVRKDWMFAQLMFWGILDGQARKGSYTRDALKDLLRDLQGREPIRLHFRLLT